MYLLEETASNTKVVTAEAHLYASKYRTVYIGCVGEYLNIKKSGSVLVVSLQQELAIECNDQAQPLMSKCVLVPAETSVKLHTHNALIAIYFIDYLGRDLHALSKHAQPIKLDTNGHVYVELPEQQSFIECLAFIYQNKPAGQRVYEMLTALYDHTSSEFRVDLRIEKVIDYIRFGEGLACELPELAAYVNLSVPRFSQLFKQVTGTNLRRFKIWWRTYLITVNLASGLSFAEAAHAAGFADYAHFSRSFLEMSGVNPSVMFHRAKRLHLDVFQPH